MKNIAVVIRVFSRTEDALSLVKIIKTLWKEHNYTIFVVHNGKSNGFLLPEAIFKDSKVIDIEENLGHKLGATQLVQKALEHITDDFEYVLFMEGDFWLLNEAIIAKYVENNCDIATTIWVESKQSLAVDFFIVKQSFLVSNPLLFQWGEHPEQDMAAYLRTCSCSFCFIEELRPTHVPSSLRKFLEFFNTGSMEEGGRFRIFPKAVALTHHVEDLKEGIATKKSMANSLSGFQIFPEVSNYRFNFFEKHIQPLAKYFPQSSWFKKKKL